MHMELWGSKGTPTLTNQTSWINPNHFWLEWLLQSYKIAIEDLIIRFAKGMKEKRWQSKGENGQIPEKWRQNIYNQLMVLKLYEKEYGKEERK